MEKKHYTQLLLRVGLAGTLIYAAVASFLTPTSWIGFFPRFFVDFSSSFMSQGTLLGIFSVAELLLAAWLLSGFKARYAGLCSATVFGGILFANLGALDLVFRDFGLLFASLALAVLSK